jgi:hypothetical protein
MNTLVIVVLAYAVVSYCLRGYRTKQDSITESNPLGKHKRPGMRGMERKV